MSRRPAPHEGPTTSRFEEAASQRILYVDASPRRSLETYR